MSWRTGASTPLAFPAPAAFGRCRLESGDQVPGLRQVLGGTGERGDHGGHTLIPNLHRGPFGLQGVEVDQLHELLQRRYETSSLVRVDRLLGRRTAGHGSCILDGPIACRPSEPPKQTADPSRDIGFDWLLLLPGHESSSCTSRLDRLAETFSP